MADVSSRLPLETSALLKSTSDRDSRETGKTIKPTLVKPQVKSEEDQLVDFYVPLESAP